MSKYTTEVRFICEQQSGLEESKGYNNVGEIIEQARPKIFDFPYPIFSNDYKPVLETKILMHYYTREISEETYGLWKLRLRTRLNDIMPYYNQLYKSELLEFNPLWDTDLSTDRDVKTDNVHEDETDSTRNIDRVSHEDVLTGGQDVSTTGGTDVSSLGGADTVSSSRNDKQNTWDLYSDTPQGSIKGIEGAEDDPSLGDNGYLTNARHVFGDTNGSTASGTTNYGRTDTTNYGRTDTTDYGRTRETDRTGNDDITGNIKSDGTSTDNVDFFERVTGYRGRNASESLLKFRETFLNIDNMIIKELRDLFFNLW